MKTPGLILRRSRLCKYQCDTKNHCCWCCDCEKSNFFRYDFRKRRHIEERNFMVFENCRSYKSIEDCGKLFYRMFPDSMIAKNFQCGERKTAYVATFGIAPYLQGRLKDHVVDSDYYVLLFDESMNKKTQEKQLDFHVRYRENKHVESHHFTSDFLGHATADDLLKSFEKCVACLPKKNLLQLSMDGPSVNWKFYKSFQESLHSRQDCQSISMINIGSCGLHIVHNAFKSGMEATEWKLNHLLFCLY